MDNKIKRIWQIVFAPMLFFIGAGLALTDHIEIGALYIIVAANDVISK